MGDRQVRRECVPYHEAGHAVVAYCVGVKFDAVSTVPGLGFKGTLVSSECRQVKLHASTRILIRSGLCSDSKREVSRITLIRKHSIF